MGRLLLTMREYEALLAAQDGVCCVQGCGAQDGLIAEHSTPNAPRIFWCAEESSKESSKPELRPGKPDQLMCAPCHKIKTLRDVKAIAKVKRLGGIGRGQYQRRKILGAQLRGRGFWKPGG
jgi:hypothetical protein